MLLQRVEALLLEALYVEAFHVSSSERLPRGQVCEQTGLPSEQDCQVKKIAKRTRLPSSKEEEWESRQLKWITSGNEERGWWLIQLNDKITLVAYAGFWRSIME